MPPLVSIIIPFYNEEQFLGRAVESAIDQTYTNVEIILVNDGSTDGSLAIAQFYRSAHKHIQLISISKNSSPGHARNIGIGLAKGSFVSFLDGDDLLLNNAMMLLVNNGIQNNADIVIGKFSSASTDSSQIALGGWQLGGGLKAGADAALAMYQYKIAYTAWGKLYKLEIAKQISFPEGLWFEDRPFLLRYFLRSKVVCFEPSRVLQFRPRPNSITRRVISKKRIEDTFSIYLIEIEAIKDSLQMPALRRAIDSHQINGFMETFILLYLDRKKVDHLHELQLCYAHTIKAFIDQLKLHKAVIGKRDWLNLTLLRLHKIVGWDVAFHIVAILKKKKCRSVFELRSY